MMLPDGRFRFWVVWGSSRKLGRPSIIGMPGLRRFMKGPLESRQQISYEEKLLGDGGGLIREVISTIQADVSSVSSNDGKEITEICTAMREALSRLEAATEWILESANRDPRLPFAASFHYLMLWGAVAGGWQMARVAGAAVRRMEQEPEQQFLHDKMLSACCYIRYVLPTSTACYAAIVSGSELIARFESRSS